MSDENPHLKPIEVSLEIHDVDPVVLGLLFGSEVVGPKEPVVSIEVWTPIKRTFWEWLRRKPRRQTVTLIPAARLTIEETP